MTCTTSYKLRYTSTMADPMTEQLVETDSVVNLQVAVSDDVSDNLSMAVRRRSTTAEIHSDGEYDDAAGIRHRRTA